jgi:enoyl-[acyl-carrier protein] reductase I
MGLFDGKKGLILGVANDRSIAWAIAEEILKQGGECGFSHLPDKPDDAKQKNRRRVSQLTDNYERARFLAPMDVQKDEDIAAIFGQAAETFGKIDFVLHAIAFAMLDDLKRDTIDTSREGFKLAMDISVYSLVAVAKAARPLMNADGAMLTMTYFGGEKCVPGYNVMGVCKSALDSVVRYLAYDLGPDKVRINALSAGPVLTLAGSAAGVRDMMGLYQQMSPLGRNITLEEVANVGSFLLSDMSRGITAEILHLDCGYNAMGSPGRLLDQIKAAQAK